MTVINCLLSFPQRFLRAWWHTVKRCVFPLETAEPILFITFFSAYCWLGNQLLRKTNIITDTLNLYGSYLGYDNLYQLYTNGGDFDIFHPLFNIFHFIKYIAVSITDKYLEIDIRATFCIALMNFIVSTALVCLYRYFRRIVQLRKYRALLLTIITSISFTTIVLSFTTGTYPFSFFLLILSLYVFSMEYKNAGTLHSYTSSPFVFFIGSISLVNALKPVIVTLLFTKTLERKALSLLSSIIPLLLCILIFAGAYGIKSFVSPSEQTTFFEENSYPIGYDKKYDENTGEKIMNDFFANTFMTSPLSQEWIKKEKSLISTSYLYGWQYIIPVMLLLLSGISLFLNIRNPYVWFIFSYLTIDIIVHPILGIGMENASAYGAHWLFAIPMLISWIYKPLPVRFYRIIDISLVFIFICIASFNLMEIYRVADKMLQLI